MSRLWGNAEFMLAALTGCLKPRYLLVECGAIPPCWWGLEHGGAITRGLGIVVVVETVSSVV